ncbi:unnamed protein product [Rotaria sordida]|uniref:G-protein coupled receptors family 1 profile domain-containing protein n=2 Tax=Rotaria sordida TaxID=392033 RepID=A0A814V6T1_9BILA|nr:unnamed protein product [Rotaria sordida]CAF3816660.1 unnamed protein product [Rotaria sordida]
MDLNATESFESLFEALNYVGFASGLYINQTLILPQRQSIWSSILNLIPLILGIIGLIFNILALIIFTASKTFRQSSFRCYIYAFVLVNCASILTHSWLYLVFYIVNPMYLCKYIQYLQQSLATTSLWIMVLLSLERSFTFIRPLTIKSLLKSRTIYFILIIATCLCFVLHIDELISVDIKAFRWVNFAYGLCSIKRYFRLATDRIKILTNSLSFIFPFLFNSILDIYICLNICQQRKRLLKRSLSMTLNHKSPRLKISLANEITLTLLCQSMWLLITYFPTHLYYFLISFKLIDSYDRDNSTLVFLIRQNLLIYLAFSPTLYVILSPTLRKEISSYLGQSYERHRKINTSYMLNTNKRLEKFTNNHQPLPNQQKYFTSLMIKNEELSQKCFSTPIKIPRKCVIKSKSLSCLFMHSNDYVLNHFQTLERSSTLHKR